MPFLPDVEPSTKRVDVRSGVNSEVGTCNRHVRFHLIATIQRTSGEVRFVLFRKWDRHYSIASAARTELPRVRLTPRGLLTHP